MVSFIRSDIDITIYTLYISNFSYKISKMTTFSKGVDYMQQQLAILRPHYVMCALAGSNYAAYLSGSGAVFRHISQEKRKELHINNFCK